MSDLDDDYSGSESDSSSHAQPPHKRSKFTVANFIDREAEEGGEDDSEGSEEVASRGLFPNRELDAHRKKVIEDDRRRRQKMIQEPRNWDDEDHLPDHLQRLMNKYGNIPQPQAGGPGGDGRSPSVNSSPAGRNGGRGDADEPWRGGDSQDYGGATPVYQADESRDKEDSQLLPSMDDPKLWMVYCQPTKERQCVIDLMNLWFRTNPQKVDKRLYISAAFTTDIVQAGYFYVEAYKEVHVRKAIERVPFTRKYKPVKVVPMDEMVHAMTTYDPEPLLKRGQWVRLKRGLYKDDIAQVIDVRDQGSKVELKMLPRIDYGSLATSSRGASFRRGHKRPNQRLFNADEIIELLETMGATDNLHPYKDEKIHRWVFKGNKYKKGYMIKEMVSTAVMGDAAPTSDEVEKFQLKDPNMDDSDDDDDMDDIPLRPSGVQRNKFESRDRVVVTEGALVNLLGLVQSMSGNTVTVIPEDERLSEPLDFDASELRKYFEIGDSIKIISSQHAGETGMVLRVEKEGREIVFWTGERQETVYSRDCTLSNEVNTGQDSIGDLELHDLVKLDHESAGCIVHIQKGQITVLNDRGMLATVSLKDIIQKLPTKFARASDINRQELNDDDMVKVREGEHAGMTGTIKHVYRSVVFLWSRQHQQNNGIFWSKARYCELIGGNPRGNRGNNQMGMKNRAGGFRVGRARRDPLMGQTVKVRRGGHKGYLGIVKGVAERGNETFCEVELHNPSVIISIPKNSVMRCDQNGRVVGGDSHGGGMDRGRHDRDRRGRSASISRPQAGSQTPLMGGRTPGHYSSGRDPFDDRRGSQTPLMGSQTPLRGNQTPLMGSQTPLHGSMTPLRGSRTPLRGSGSMTPLHGGSRTPLRGSQTPGAEIWDVGSKTPQQNHYEEEDDDDMNPATPNYNPSYNNAQTPATPNYTDPSTPMSPHSSSTSNSMARDSPRTVNTPIEPNSPFTPSSPGMNAWNNSGDPQTPSGDNPNSPFTPYTPGGGMTSGNGGEPMTPVTPGGELYRGGTSPMTPGGGGINPFTPVPNTPGTPSGGMSSDGQDSQFKEPPMSQMFSSQDDYAHAPATPMTPGSGISSQNTQSSTSNPDTPHTPATPISPASDAYGADTNMSPFTPQSPGELMASDSGGEISDTADERENTKFAIPSDDGAGELVDWKVVGVVVNFEGREGTIDQVLGDDQYEIKFSDDNSSQTANTAEMEKAKPEKDDKVYILHKEHRGKVGEIIGIENQEGIVQIQTHFFVESISALAKFNPDYPEPHHDH